MDCGLTPQQLTVLLRVHDRLPAGLTAALHGRDTACGQRVRGLPTAGRQLSPNLKPPRDLDRPPERFPSALPPREPASLSRPHEAVSARPCGDRTPAAPPVFGVRLTRSLNESLVEFSGLVGHCSDLPIGRRTYRPGATCPGPLPTGAAGGDPGDRANPASELSMLSARRRPGPASAHPISRSMSTESNAALPHRPANTGSATFNSRVTALAASSRCRAGRGTSSLSAG